MIHRVVHKDCGNRVITYLDDHDGAGLTLTAFCEYCDEEFDDVIVELEGLTLDLPDELEVRH